VPELPHQVMRNPRAACCCLLAMAVTVAGCASPESAARREFRPVHFPAPDVEPRVVVYGDLRALLPVYDRTPLLDLFLYGPNDYGKTILRNPQGMSMLGGRLLVCDQGLSEIVAIDLADGKSLIWGDPDHRPRCPVAVSVDEQGCVYVADTTLQSVLRYGPDGRFIEELKPTDGSAEAFRPAAVLARNGLVYVGNVARHRIDRWDSSRRMWIEPLAPPPDSPPLVAPTGLAFTAEGVLLIADAVSARVLRSSPDGVWLKPIGRPGLQDGQFVRPKQVCVSGTGLILVADAGRQSVVVFDRNGKFVTEVREQPGAWSGMTLPAGLLALSPGQLSIPPREGDDAAQSPAEYVIVSDLLGSDSLVLLGVFVQPAEEPNDAR